MNQSSTDFEMFLEWFSNLEEIELEIRRDFFGHLVSVGYLDEKSIKFIDDSLNNLEQTSKERIVELQNELAERVAELEFENNKETSTVERIYRVAETKFKKLVTDFKKSFQYYQKSELKKEETTEQQQNQDEINQLKASLG